MIFERHCASCGVYFTTANYKERTHSMGCRIAYDRKKSQAYCRKRYLLKKKEAQAIYTQECLVCGNKFETNRLDREVLCFGCKLNKKQVIDRNMTKEVGVFNEV